MTDGHPKKCDFEPRHLNKKADSKKTLTAGLF